MKLPRRCFISHAYADAIRRDRLIASLPPDVEPVTFPPIVVPPDELVSSALLETLSSCDGLVYLDGGPSDDSFWVAFERDYALRAGKAVFAADSQGRLTTHVGRALDLATFASYHRQDRERVRAIGAFLRDERHFDLWIDVDDLAAGDDFARTIETSIHERLARGGYVIVFWSRATRESRFVENEIQRAVQGMPGGNDRVLFARLDDTPLRAFWAGQDHGVQMFGDTERGEKNRWDDLVVRLYWLIYRKTKRAS
ncbi:MAG: toll/interleukin-1 receptor domain-containing protein [Vicinamibacterales bacterium]